MSAAQAERLQSALIEQVEEKNRQAEWWRRNASVRHGVPFDEGKRKLNVQVNEQPKVVEQQPPQVVHVPQQPANASGLPDWAKWLGASLLPLGAAAGGYWLANRPDPQPPPAVESPDKSGSLYQYLEDHGYHLPE